LAYSLRVRVTWDPAKSRTNRAKHGVSFAEAQRLFTSGTDYLEIFDDEHSDSEDRFFAIGPIRRGLVLIVFTEQDDDLLRIISARWATKRERALYLAHVEHVETRDE
jgi:uncharacterized DUF497 family protein